MTSKLFGLSVYPDGARVSLEILESTFARYSGMRGQVIHSWFNEDDRVVMYQIRIEYRNRFLILEVTETEVYPAY